MLENELTSLQRNRLCVLSGKYGYIGFDSVSESVDTSPSDEEWRIVIARDESTIAICGVSW